MIYAEQTSTQTVSNYEQVSLQIIVILPMLFRREAWLGCLLKRPIHSQTHTMLCILAKHSLQLPPIKIPPPNLQIFKAWGANETERSVEGKLFLITTIKREQGAKRKSEKRMSVWGTSNTPVSFIRNEDRPDTYIIDSLLSSIKESPCDLRLRALRWRNASHYWVIMFCNTVQRIHLRLAQLCCFSDPSIWLRNWCYCHFERHDMRFAATILL